MSDRQSDLALHWENHIRYGLITVTELRLTIYIFRLTYNCTDLILTNLRRNKSYRIRTYFWREILRLFLLRLLRLVSQMRRFRLALS